MRIPSILVLSFAAAPLFAQAKPALTPLADVRGGWKQVTGYLLESANDMPEAKYAYKPTPSVRSFGELIGHVAGSQMMFCAIALGEKPPAEDAVEKGAKTKAALVAALKESNTACEKAYAQAEAGLGAKVELFGQQMSKFYTLVLNTTHDNEHYGNVVTYLRMNGMVPPSSKPAK